MNEVKTPETIMIIEDDPELRSFISETLYDAGFFTKEAESYSTGLGLLEREKADLLLLDLHLGEKSGLDILKYIKKKGMDIPVIIVSTLSEIQVKIQGFEIGCSDYVTKPFIPEELIARIKNLLRKRQINKKRQPVLQVGPFLADKDRHQIKKDGEPIELRRRIFEIFYYFLEHPNQVISKEQLFHRFWESHDETSVNSLSVHLHELRKHIEKDPKKPEYLKTIRNIGYKLNIE